MPGITDFEDRVAFVTGGARGIGLGVARALLRRGARVVVADIDPGALERARREFPQASDRLHTAELNVADRDQYAAVGDIVGREVGHVSLLFNVAGIIDSVSPSQLSYGMWDYVMGINLAGVYNGIQTFAPAMVASKQRAHIVNVASEAGVVEAGSGFLYHASKAAVLGMSESLRRELAHMDVGVSVLFPGPVATDIVQNTRGVRPDTAVAHSERVTKILDTAHQHLNRMGADPEAVGELVLDAVERDQPYIATRNEIGGQLAERNRALLAAMQYAESFLAEHRASARAR